VSPVQVVLLPLKGLFLPVLFVSVPVKNGNLLLKVEVVEAEVVAQVPEVQVEVTDGRDSLEVQVGLWEELVL
jgi:hypothetical protein